MRESINRTLPLGVTILSDSITTCLLPGRLLPEAVTVKDADRTTGGKDMADRAAVCVQPLQQGRDWSEATEAEDARIRFFLEAFVVNSTNRTFFFILYSKGLSCAR